MIGGDEDAPVGFIIRGGDDQARVRALLEAQLTYSRRRRQRRQALAALAVSSVLPFLSMASPGIVPSPVRALGLIAWCALVLLALAAAASEARWHRRMACCADDLTRIERPLNPHSEKDSGWA